MISIQNTRKLASFGLAIVMSAASVAAMADVMVGGAPMLPSKDIIDNAVNSKDHTTLVAAVKAAGLVDTLKGPGPDRKSTRLNSSHSQISYAVFCLKKKKKQNKQPNTQN